MHAPKPNTLTSTKFKVKYLEETAKQKRGGEMNFSSLKFDVGSIVVLQIKISKSKQNRPSMIKIHKFKKLILTPPCWRCNANFQVHMDQFATIKESNKLQKNDR